MEYLAYKNRKIEIKEIEERIDALSHAFIKSVYHYADSDFNFEILEMTDEGIKMYASWRDRQNDPDSAEFFIPKDVIEKNEGIEGFAEFTAWLSRGAADLVARREKEAAEAHAKFLAEQEEQERKTLARLQAKYSK